MSAFVVALAGGEAHGAWFEGHALREIPETVEIAVGSDVGPALLDLPEDELELGERLITYELQSVGIVCKRGKGRCCSRVATYAPRATAA